MVTVEAATAWVSKAFPNVRRLFRRAWDAVTASRPYQWLDHHVIDAPPIKATTFIGYVLTLTLTLLVLFIVGIWVVTSNVRSAARTQIDNLGTEVRRLRDVNADLIRNATNDSVLMKSSLDECRAMLVAPKAPLTVIPKNKRGAASSPRKAPSAGYRGARPE